MAKLTSLPSLDIIDGMKGTIDYYLHDGVACARSWPRSPGHDRAPAVMEQWAPFTWAASNWAPLPPNLKTAFNRMASGIPMTGKDIFIKSYLSNAHIIIGPSEDATD